MDGIVTKLALLVIVATLAYFVWQWWQEKNRETYVAPSNTTMVDEIVTSLDEVPKEPGITMYGSEGCPWCIKQKDYFKEKNMEYTFVDCEKTPCPRFVTGFPTLVKDGQVIPGYNEI